MGMHIEILLNEILKKKVLLGVVPQSFCGESEFQCAGGFCIMGYKRCNGIRDCPSGNDEDGCPPPVTDIPGMCTAFIRECFPLKIKR